MKKIFFVSVFTISAFAAMAGRANNSTVLSNTPEVLNQSSDEIEALASPSRRFFPMTFNLSCCSVTFSGQTALNILANGDIVGIQAYLEDIICPPSTEVWCKVPMSETQKTGQNSMKDVAAAKLLANASLPQTAAIKG